MNFSFAGCGFLGIYHVGVSACLKKYAPNLLVNKISGASAGALAAVSLLCDGPLGLITSSILKTATEARKRLLGPFSPTFNIENLLRDGLLNILPADAHERVNGRVNISVTRVSDGKNVLLSHFDTREDLIQALLCSCFIPGFSGWIPLKFKGVRYVDGGFSDNLPQLDENSVTVSPFCGEADICPKDFTAGLVTISLANTSIELSRENLYRFTLILFPPPPEVLNRMCQQGFNDALEFLQRNNLINCTRCLAVHSTFNLESNMTNDGIVLQIDDYDDDEDYDDEHLNCDDCNLQRQEAILDTLPEAVGSILQEAIDKANKGLMNWVFKHKSMKFVSILTLPYIIPFEIVYTTFLKLLSSSPNIQDLKNIGLQIIQLIKALVRTWLTKPQPPHHHPRHHRDKKFSCQLSITEFTGEGDMQMVNGERQSFDFAVDVTDGNEMQTHRDAMNLGNEALNQLALRCAAKSVSHLSTGPSRNVSKNPSRAPSRAASRAVSRAVSRIPSYEELSTKSTDWNDFSNHVSDDAFEQILNVTNRHDAVMAYYYMDDKNEMKVTEIFDMTSSVEEQQRNQAANMRELNEGDLQSHLESFKEMMNVEEKMKLTNFPHGSHERSSDQESTISEPEVDQHAHQ